MEQNNLQETIKEVSPAGSTPVQPPKAPETAPSVPKNNKALTWCLGIIAVISITAAAIFAYLYFATPIVTPQPPETDSTEETSIETKGEAEITDIYVLRDLDEKMAILHNTTQTTPTIKFIGGAIKEMGLYRDGDLSNAAKLAHVAMSINDTYKPSEEEKKILGDKNIEDAIKAEIFDSKYIDVFGKQPSLSNDESRYCPNIEFNETFNAYYIDTGCGGTSPMSRYYYKNKYTADDNHAYVYVNAGAIDGESGTLYCDVYNKDNPPATCGEYSEDFTIDENNYQNFTQYRFIFNKADNGTYYFYRVEKL